MGMDTRVAIVTGAGQEIGRHIACRLAADGFHVAVIDLNLEKSQETVRGIEERYGGSAQALQADVTSIEEVDRAVAAVNAARNRIDVLVNNAGVPGPVKETEEITLEEWRHTLDVNLTGAFICCRQVIPMMKRQASGVIVNIASVSGKRPMPLRLPYAVSKMGLIGFTRTLAAEVGKWNIRVNSVCPGSVIGPRQKLVFEGIMKATGRSWDEVAKDKAESAALKRFVDPKDVAAVVSFLAGDDSRIMTGQDINVCAGAVMY